MKLHLSGHYVTITETPDQNLKLELTSEGKEYLQDISELTITDRTANQESVSWSDIAESEIRFSKTHAEILDDLLEDVCCNSDLEILNPNTDYERIGALTDAPIIAFDAIRDDHGTLQKADRVWWFPSYAVESEIETLYSTGEVVFRNGEL